MSVFVDTSALLAVLDANEANHPQSAATWRDLISSGAALVTSSYVVVELFALAQRRLGMGSRSGHRRRRNTDPARGLGRR